MGDVRSGSPRLAPGGLDARLALPAGLGASFAVKLCGVYGIGAGGDFAPPRTMTVIDATVWLQVLNPAAFLWFGRRLCGADPAPTAGPSGSRHPPESSSR